VEEVEVVKVTVITNREPLKIRQGANLQLRPIKVIKEQLVEVVEVRVFKFSELLNI
jgi:hypothetical protein